MFPESYRYLEERGLGIVYSFLDDEARTDLEVYRDKGSGIQIGENVSRSQESEASMCRRCGNDLRAAMLLALFCLTSFAHGASPPPLESLIADLGHSDYTVRERATIALQVYGRAARAALERAARSDDIEVRLRACELLTDIRLGIEADWPDDAKELARGYEALPHPQRTTALRQLRKQLGAQATFFLLARLDEPEGPTAWREFCELKNTDAPERILAAWPQPALPTERRAVVWAYQTQNNPLPALRTLLLPEPLPNSASLRWELIDQAVATLLTLWEKKQFQELAQTANELVQLVPDEARFRYLAAEGVESTDAKAATMLRNTALSLAPDDEAAHYHAAKLLQNLHRDALAAREWERILAIPPVDEIYDLNAFLKLGQYHAQQAQYDKAAEFMARALRICQLLRAQGKRVAPIGLTEKELEELITRWRGLAGDGFAVAIALVLPDADQTAFDKAIEDGAIVLPLRIQPSDLRLFDLDATTLRYDPSTKTIVPLLNGEPCMTSLRVPLRPDKRHLLVCVADCYYLYEVHLETGAATQQRRWEGNYRLRVQPGPRIAAWRDVTVKLNAQVHDWMELQRGIMLDHLPAKLIIEISGTDPEQGLSTARWEKEIP